MSASDALIFVGSQGTRVARCRRREPLLLVPVACCSFLNINDNGFYGNVTSVIEQLTSLQSLQLGYNQLSSTLPDAISRLTGLS